MDVGIAVFVKTPGLSPIKTRLGKKIDQINAETFHLLSCASIQETLLDAKEKLIKKGINLYPYWAVAEKEGLNLPHWKEFPTLLQYDGDLGERQHTIYEELLHQHQAGILIGADCPQLSVENIIQSIHSINSNIVFIPSTDGGYVLLAGKRELDLKIWKKIPWSQENTLEEFKKNLRQLDYKFECLPSTRDVDELEDLKELKKHFEEREKDLNLGQKKLLSWLKQLFVENK